MVGALILAGGACGTDSSAESTSSSRVADAASPAADDGPLAIRPPAVGGGEIDLGALAGTPVALWFWAPT